MLSAFTDSLVADAVEQSGFRIVDRAAIGSREAKLLPVPSCLDPAVRELVESRYPQGLYSHQAKAIEAGLGGSDVCLATSTASGKSLAFMAVAADLLRRDRAARALAMYPARALIQDQIEKWKTVLSPLSMQIGYIDGGVSIERRPEILRASRVVLMTPDVAHAWLMTRLGEWEISNFIESLCLLVLDECHVYDGVFGTNMAYFLRRLEVAAGPYQMICSTATIGEPDEFMEHLTGRKPRVFSLEEDGSPSPPKTILLANEVAGEPFESIATLMATLARAETGRFLAFADSRRMVEQIVAAAHRSTGVEDDSEDFDDTSAAAGAEKGEREDNGIGGGRRLLPYRAGYETGDRNEIQKALEQGQLAGVVSTSALELGLDIGEIDLVVLLTLPPSVKAFCQRLGRGGRRNHGVCLLVDNRRVLVESPGGLETYLQRSLEPNYLYLENRYIQYSNALCAAFELGESGGTLGDMTPFQSLPNTFRQFLENELNPTESIPPDLYLLKQRAQAGPHREFPIRTGIEQNFEVVGPHSRRLGNETFSQALREAYPGAIYYYMARPYRVFTFKYRTGEILVKRERYWTTRPLSQTMVFPRFQGGILTLFQSETGFLAETEMQVSERVSGFTEQRGSVKEDHLYGPYSPYYQRALNRFFETTGVCWYFPERHTISEAIASRILEAFCVEFGVHGRDLGVGLFHSKQSPLGMEKCQGVCVFDATHGSLRLTQRLAELFSDVLTAAISIARSQEDADLAVNELKDLEVFVSELRPAVPGEGVAVVTDAEEDWVIVIAPGERAVYESQDGSKEVKVLGHRYTPRGLMYDLEHPSPETRWTVSSDTVQAIYGETKRIRVNLVTGETEQLS